MNKEPYPDNDQAFDPQNGENVPYDTNEMQQNAGLASEETQVWGNGYAEDSGNADPAGVVYDENGYGYEAEQAAYPEDGYQDAAYHDQMGQAEWPADMTGTYASNIGSGAWLGEDLPLEEERPKRTIFKPRTRKPSFVLAVLVNSFRMLMLLVLLLGLSGLGAVIGVAKAYMETAPTLDLAAIDDQAQTSFIYDASGNMITEYKGSENRIMVSIDTMPMNLRHAFVAVEDARFYTHNGIDIKRIVGAFVSNFVSGTQQGGSTITQQLIKNTLLSSEQSYKRKIQEAYLAMQLETRYTKNEILEAYLNTIYLGEDYYGVKVAAYGFFGRDSLNDLTLRECAMLAGMTNNPYYYNPRRNFYTRQSDTTDYRKIVNDRTDYVLRCMYENQFITRDQYLAALDPATARVLEKSPSSTELYPYAHYVEYAIKDVVKTLLTIKGLEDTSANRNKMENELRTGGYHVYLALDTQMQTIVENTLQTYKDYPALRDPGDKVYRARNSDGTYDEIIQPQAAAVVLDYRSGEIKAIVGGRTAPTKRKTLNRAADMNMPVGSSIKPISVYAPAIELGAGGGTVLYNMPLPVKGYRGSDGKDTWPKNYGGSSYRGPETLRTALTKSDNTAAAYALMNFVGLDRSQDFLLRLGVSEKHINKTPFGLALGSSGITPMEMAVAYGVLANSGVYQSPITFLGIADRNRNTVYDAHANQVRRQVFKPSTAYLTVDIMKDVVSSGTGTAAKISGQTVAGKTGTNSDQKGVFFAGITGWYVGTVWIGHDNYKALSSKTTGGNSAAKLWKAFMQPIHKNLGNRDIMEGKASDYGLVKVTTCKVSGQVATDACKHDAMNYGTSTDYWPRDNAPTVSCQMHYALNVCTDTGLLAGANCPNQETKGVVILPMGHPLYSFIGTKYDGALSDYLGEFATLKLTGDGNANAALLNSRACTLHQSGATFGHVSVQGDLASDARQLLDRARNQLAQVSANHPGYANLSSAIDYLSYLLDTDPDSSQLAAAMSNLTAAMATAR